MFTSVDKALVAIIMGVVFIAQSLFHWQPASWLTADNVTQLVAVATPVLVWLVPNKPMIK